MKFFMSNTLRVETGFEDPKEFGGFCEPDRCQLCNGSLVPRFHVPGDWRRPEEDLDYHVSWCRICELGGLQPTPSQEELEDAYRVPYMPHAPVGAHDRTSSVKSGLLTRIFDRLLGWRPGVADIDKDWVRQEFGDRPLRICELGCGSGRLLEEFRAAGHRVVGVEPSESAREIAHAQGLEVFGGTAESPPEEIRTQSFDVVLMNHVLEHCRDPKRALERAWSLLEPNGRLVAETPNNEAAGLQWAKAAWPWLDIPRHLHFFTAKSLHQICEDSGFEVSSVDFRGYARQFQQEWVESERHIASFVSQRGETTPPWVGSAQGRWLLLAKTLLAAPQKRFDSVRILARRSDQRV
jgi:2-polyprenyl-3-methyl-5-hydroxy-6-metoxy-1,4-benzoquinol methylase